MQYEPQGPPPSNSHTIWNTWPPKQPGKGENGGAWLVVFYGLDLGVPHTALAMIVSSLKIQCDLSVCLGGKGLMTYSMVLYIPHTWETLPSWPIWLQNRYPCWLTDWQHMKKPLRASTVASAPGPPAGGEAPSCLRAQPSVWDQNRYSDPAPISPSIMCISTKKQKTKNQGNIWKITCQKFFTFLSPHRQYLTGTIESMNLNCSTERQVSGLLLGEHGSV